MSSAAKARISAIGSVTVGDDGLCKIDDCIDSTDDKSKFRS